MMDQMEYLKLRKSDLKVNDIIEYLRIDNDAVNRVILIKVIDLQSEYNDCVTGLVIMHSTDSNKVGIINQSWPIDLTDITFKHWRIRKI